MKAAPPMMASNLQDGAETDASDSVDTSPGESMDRDVDTSGDDSDEVVADAETWHANVSEQVGMPMKWQTQSATRLQASWRGQRDRALVSRRREAAKAIGVAMRRRLERIQAGSDWKQPHASTGAEATSALAAAGHTVQMVGSPRPSLTTVLADKEAEIERLKAEKAAAIALAQEALGWLEQFQLPEEEEEEAEAAAEEEAAAAATVAAAGAVAAADSCDNGGGAQRRHSAATGRASLAEIDAKIDADVTPPQQQYPQLDEEGLKRGRESRSRSLPVGYTYSMHAARTAQRTQARTHTNTRARKHARTHACTHAYRWATSSSQCCPT